MNRMIKMLSLLAAMLLLLTMFFVYIVFSLILSYFLISLVTSLTHWLFKSVLLNFHIFVNIPVFLVLFLVSFYSDQKGYFL